MRGTWENVAGNPASPTVMAITTHVWANQPYSKLFVLAQGPELACLLPPHVEGTLVESYKGECTALQKFLGTRR